jgi:cytochrome c5
MKNKIVLLVALSLGFLICCKTTSKTGGNSMAPGPDDEKIAQEKWSGTTLAELTSGYQLYTAKCQECHKLHRPTEYDEAKWTKIVPWMGKKAKLNEADQQLILHYLVAKREVLSKSKP